MLQRLGIGSRPELAVFLSLLLLVSISPLGREATHPIVMVVYRTLLLAIFVAGVLMTIREGLRICPYFLGLSGLIVAIMAINVVVQAGSHAEGAYRFYENVLFAAAFISLASLARSRSFRWKTAILGWVVLVNLTYLIAAIVTGGRPLQGPFVNPNYFASFLMVGLAVCAAVILFADGSRLRIAAAAAAALLYYGIGRTSSRGATLAALAMLAFTLVRAARRSSVRWAHIMLALAALSVATIVVNPALMSKFLDRGQTDPYNYQRIQIWKATLEMIQDHPVMGVGLGQYWHISKQYTPAVEGAIARYGKLANIAHSEYLQHMAEIGVPAAVLMFALSGYLLTLAWRRAKAAPAESCLFHEAALNAAAALSIHALVDNNWTVPVVAAGMAVVTLADLLPYAGKTGTDYSVPVFLRFRKWGQSSLSPFSPFSPSLAPVRWAAFGLGIFAILMHSTVIPGLGLYFNEAGHRAYVAEDLQRARVMHRYGLGFLPDHPVLLDNLGLVHLDSFMKTRDREALNRAESFFKQAMAANPTFDSPARHLENVLIERLTGDPKRDQSMHAQIIEVDRKILKMNPFNPFIRKNLAEALYNRGERELALEELRKAVELEPNYVPAYLRLAEWYREDGRAQESDEYRKRAIEVVVQYQEEQRLDPFDALLLGRPQVSLSRP